MHTFDRVCFARFTATAIAFSVALLLTAVPSASSAAEHAGRAADAEDAGTVVTILSRMQPMLANVTDEYEVVRLWPASEAFDAAREMLAKQCPKLEFAETPLRTVIGTISEQTGLAIAFDHETLENIGFDLDTPVTIRLTGRSVRDALRAVLHDLDLAAVFRNDQIVITTRDSEATTLEKVFYPVFPGVDAEAVAVMIEETIEPQTWAVVGGIGTITVPPAGLGHGLVIAQSSNVHEEIEAVLRALDAATWGRPAAGDGPRPPCVRVYEIEDDRIRGSLEAGIEAGLVGLVNESLPRGADPEAKVFALGRSIVVRSTSRGFHVMAAQLIVALTGFEQEKVAIETDLSDEEAASVAADADT